MSEAIGRRNILNLLLSLLVLGSLCLPRSLAQQPPAAAANSVPTLVKFSGTLNDADGKPLPGTSGVTFSLYADQQGGSPLWTETQNVQADRSGHYSVLLGSTASTGLPAVVFASGEARWVGEQVQGQPEGPRVMLISVPYAIKAGDAQTIGGLPATAFVLAAPPNSGVSPVPSSVSTGGANSPPASGSGTTNYVPLWTDSNGTLGNSALFQGGTAKQPKIGIGTVKPASALDVKGGGTIRGMLSLPSTGTATPTAGKNSQPVDLAASVFNSNTSTAVTQTFQWQAEPMGNNTSGAIGSLNLLFGQGTSKPAETGLSIAHNGLLTFAPGQTFPGTGSGTITGVTAGTDLTGGGSSGNVTLNLDTSHVPLLNAKNNFTADQSIDGNLTSTATITAAAAQFGPVTIFASDVGLQIAGGVTAIQVVGNGDGIEGQSDELGAGVAGYGLGPNSEGILGYTNNAGGYGVFGTNQGPSGQGVWGETSATGSSNGAGPDGVHGVTHSAAGSGVAGINDAAGGIAVYGRELATNSYAGRFDGNVWVNGNLSKNGGSFKIDHPLDPANKYLYHSFVESPDMKNIYDGVVILGASGDAVVTMPGWFGALNRDFRYQLTCIGGFAPVYIAEEIANNQFRISGGKPGMKISWQVTGTRQDAWANAHRIPVEEIKPGDEHGTYLHPELFGAPEQSAVGWGRYRFPDNVQPHRPQLAPTLRNHGNMKSGRTGASVPAAKVSGQ